ncbi:HUS1 [Cervus elaphus hippelaphus]|uniref:Checkpoint protein n=1 Tax=Cervus elaphus hippelaphus TaxID=46360 RepID=A0A212CLF7_CEREH|nr:HUS1 [Cervus elaphus hippelaphus]
MKFRAKIVDTACLNHFTHRRLQPGSLVPPPQPCLSLPRPLQHSASPSGRVSNMIAKLAKTCTLRISPDKLNFVLSDKVANGGVSMWCELEQVSIYLPVLKTMKSVVEKMKNISNQLVSSDFFEKSSQVYCKILNLQIIEANLNGELNLKIETELVCVTTHFKDLGNPPLASENASQDRNSEQMAEVHIDIRKLLQFLAGQQVNPTKATCNIVKNKIVHFDLLHEDVSLQYFIPALS